jgi:hypothetical protein
MDFSRGERGASSPAVASRKKENMNIIEKIDNGDYDTKLPYFSYKENSAKRAEYDVDQNRLHEEFTKDALASVKLSDHPNAQKIFDKAWEDGHSSGYKSVYSELEDLAALVLVEDSK